MTWSTNIENNLQKCVLEVKEKRVQDFIIQKKEYSKTSSGNPQKLDTMKILKFTKKYTTKNVAGRIKFLDDFGKKSAFFNKLKFDSVLSKRFCATTALELKPWPKPYTASSSRHFQKILAADRLENTELNFITLKNFSERFKFWLWCQKLKLLNQIT